MKAAWSESEKMRAEYWAAEWVETKAARRVELTVASRADMIAA